MSDGGPYSRAYRLEGNPTRSITGSLDSSPSSQNEQAYRNISLRSVRIFINELQPEHWPLDIRTFVEQLLAVEDVVEDTDTVSAVPLVLPDNLRNTCAALSRQASRCQAGPKPGWMRLAREMLGFHDHPYISVYENETIDVQADLTSENSEPLSTPTPDLIFGLAVFDSQGSQSPAPILSTKLLARLGPLCGVQSFPRQDVRDIAFPCVIFEAESDSGTLLAAENRAAHAAANALIMLKNLTAVAQAPHRLPMVVICSQGSIYEVLVSFELQADEIPPTTDPSVGWGRHRRPKSGIQLVEIWTGNVRRAEVMLEFQKIWYRVMRWVLNTWRPTIIRMLDDIKATMPEEEQDEEM
ncbi:hypothetical protein BCV69DRAFT_282215 [Microstroma glucosiphilum]|uniref:Uncharacterized protein n=1 Tax=Pseudomicrostroma glucosiphilum TaxID=1684307 RepID=A0A316U8K4_9BASI|nr:hypothetical protein BCV69DRAFT_282215 [Pseudomicrostroma glucosiphilum]PWN21492.1 hypothetical protein BCV69DRAFT_282215 [Pseudomicrostroma glucosiphilum]